jgi:hypothetical protein
MCAKEHREKLWFELIALSLKILGCVSFMEFNMYDNVKIVFLLLLQKKILYDIATFTKQNKTLFAVV